MHIHSSGSKYTSATKTTQMNLANAMFMKKKSEIRVHAVWSHLQTVQTQAK